MFGWIYKWKTERERRRLDVLIEESLTRKGIADKRQRDAENRVWQLADALGLSSYAEAEAIIRSRERESHSRLADMLHQQQNYRGLTSPYPASVFGFQGAGAVYAGVMGWR